MPDSYDAKLVRRAQAGDRRAVGELYDLYNERIFRYVWSRVSHREQAEDLTGEVFTRMVSKLGDYSPQGVPFQAWLYRIAHNLVIDHYRKEGGRVVISLDHAEGLHGEKGNTAAVVEQHLTMQQVRDALQNLDPLQREVLALRFLGGLSLREVAITIDKTVSAVKALQYRGLVALRAELQVTKQRIEP